MREHELKQLEEQVQQGVMPSYSMLKRYESGLTDHVGGQALGYKTKYIVRLYVEDQETRVAVLEKRTFLPSMIAARYKFVDRRIKSEGNVYKVSAEELADLKRRELQREIDAARKKGKQKAGAKKALEKLT